MKRFQPARRGDDGAIIALFALCLVAIFVSVAFAVDLGRLSAERRDQQANADVIALDLVRLATGVTEDQILASSDYATTLARSASDNDVDIADLTVDFGLYDPATDTFVETTGNQVPNAVRVLARGTARYFFAGAFTDDRDGRTSRTGIAGLDAVADLALGSRTADMNAGEADRLNFLLKNRLSGADFGFSAADYQGLANSNVTYEDISIAAGFGSPDEFIDAEITLAQYAQASADAFNANGDPNSAAVAAQLANRSAQRDLALGQPNRRVKLRDILDVDVGGPPQWAGATANFFDLFIAAAEAINGDNFTEVCTAIPGFDDGFVEVPGPLGFDPATEITNPSATMCTTTVEAARWIINGRVGASAKTAQLRIKQTAEGDLSLPGIVALPFSGRASMPATLEAAGARADLSAIRCNRINGDHRTDTFVTPEPLTMDIGGPGPEFTLSAGGLVTVTVEVTKSLIPPTDSPTLIGDQVISTVEPGPGSSPTLGFTLDPDDVSVTVTVGTLTPGQINTLKNLLVPRLNVLLKQIDVRGTTLLDQFGIGVSDSDLLLDAVRCDSPLLVG